jgi:hypothetical protein
VEIIDSILILMLCKFIISSTHVAFYSKNGKKKLQQSIQYKIM